MVTNLKVHKAFPQYEGLTGFLKTFFSYISPYIRVKTPEQHNTYPTSQGEGNVVISVQRKYKRLTTYGFYPLEKPSDGYRLTIYDSRVLLITFGTVCAEIIRIEDI